MNLSLTFLCMFICEHRSSFLLSTYLGNFETIDNIGINYFPYLLNHLTLLPSECMHTNDFTSQTIYMYGNVSLWFSFTFTL